MEIERCNEIDLIQQTLAGKTSAFDQLVRMYRSTIYVLVLSYIKNPADAEDLTQRIFIRAYERLATLRELDCFLAWLQQIAHNTCKDWLRRRSELATSIDAVKDADFSETAPSAEDIVLKAEVENIVRKAIDGLKESDRKLMEAHFIEGASYDELRAESGLSYAAIANRLKRAKQEVRRRVRKLLGGVAILPGRKLILGGIEAVKLSVKAKVAMVAVAAVIGISGAGVLYQHAYQSPPVLASLQEVSEAGVATRDSLTNIARRTDATSRSSSTLKRASMSKKGEANRFGISTDDGVKIVDVKSARELLAARELPDEIVEELLNTQAKNHAHVWSDDSMVFVATTPLEMTEEMLESLPEEWRQAISKLEIHDDNTDTNIWIGSDQNLSEEERQILREGLKKGGVNVDILAFKTEELPGQLKQKSAGGGFAANVGSVDALTDPQVESTIIPSGPSKGTTPLSNEEWAEFERLMSVSGEFSDEEWTELERLLDITSGRTTPQQDRQAPLNAERQRQIEDVLEEPPALPSGRQGMWRQRHVLPESNTDVPSHPTTEDWHRTTK